MNDTHPSEVLVNAGLLVVPLGAPTHDFSAVEQSYRGELWPRVADGYKRWRRELEYVARDTMVRFAIYDVPTEASVIVRN